MVRENLCILPADVGIDDEAVMTDRDWVRSAQDGDEEAFAQLVRRHSGGLHRAVARILADDSEAWDVVQMAFLKAWQRLDRYDPRYRFSTWLYRIGTNLAIDLLRSRSSRERIHKTHTEHRLRLVGAGEGAGSRADTNEADRILGQLVGVLTPQQRSAFVLREMQGLDTAEVAEVLGCSATTVRNHIFQARKALRGELRAQFPEYLPASERG
ncbi:MAG: sigma-70 family RNA polymerase sigma factor [Acidobacteria bacterium]|nr:sigma-70 family RNA polymerase sigma factor [Candidatus Sulfomarinibacter sp. MAG AM1]